MITKYFQYQKYQKYTKKFAHTFDQVRSKAVSNKYESVHVGLYVEHTRKIRIV